MKIYLLMLIFALGLGDCSNKGGDIDARVDGTNSNVKVEVSDSISEADEGNSNVTVSGSGLKVDVYEGGELVSSCVYEGGLLREEIDYKSDPSGQDHVIKYYYKGGGEYDRLEITSGQASVFDEIFDRSMRDFRTQSEYLRSKNIRLPAAAEILSGEVSDLSNVLSVADNYRDFKREAQADGSQKVFRFVGFNKNIRFHPSTITAFIHENEIIKDYELTLKDDYPQTESYKTGEGELTKEYFYDDERKIVRLIYKFKSKEDQSSLEKKFDYHILH